MAAPPAAEALRAAVGAGLALFLCGSMLAWLAADGTPGSDGGLFLIAPLGASAFLLFALPNSPLAQPWSTVVGNTVSGVVAVTVLLLVGSGPVAAGVAVAGAMVTMSLLRAMHPPGGAIALATMLAGDQVVELAYGFVLAPILLDTLLLVAAAMLFHRLTGRTYPLGHYPEPGRHGTTDPDPLLRLGLNSEELQQLVQRFRQSTNIGLEDLAEMLAAAEETLATKKVDNLTCADIMSRHLVTVTSGTSLTRVAALFRAHHFKTLPVVDENGRIAGIISQNDFIQRAIAAPELRASTLLGGTPRATMRWRGRAADIMTTPVISVKDTTPVGALIPLLADHGVQAVPINADERLVGVVTRSDLLAVLAEHIARDDGVI